MEYPAHSFIPPDCDVTEEGLCSSTRIEGSTPRLLIFLFQVEQRWNNGIPFTHGPQRLAPAYLLRRVDQPLL
jgi:hypothetical protein